MSNQSAPLFDELWDYSDPEATAGRLNQLLSDAEATADASYLGQLLTQLARTHSLRRRFDQAHQILDRVEEMLPEAGDLVQVRYLLERGRTYNSANQQSEAQPLFEKAWEAASAAGHEFYAVDAAHMMGIAGATPEIQLAWNNKAMRMAESSDNRYTRRWLGSLYNNLGWTYHDRGKYEEALSLFQRALDFRQSQPDPFPSGPVRIARWCVARALRSLGRLEKALRIQQSLVAEWEKDGQHDGYVFEEVGECLLALEREHEARTFFKLAYQQLSQDSWLAANEPKRLDRLHTLAGDA